LLGFWTWSFIKILLRSFTAFVAFVIVFRVAEVIAISIGGGDVIVVYSSHVNQYLAAGKSMIQSQVHYHNTGSTGDGDFWSE
jgi:hypothetical protein